MLRVGLTGGIACGKSRVLARLAARGLSTLDLDRVAHEVIDPGGTAHDEVLAAFGRGVLDPQGRVDRRALGQIVFGDAAARDRLNGIVHPRVREIESRWVAREAGRGAPIAVTDAALLVESGVHLRFDRLLVVHCSPDEQLRRLISRDGIDARAAQARIDAQMPIDEKRRFGHVEIDTGGATSDTDRRAEAAAAGLEDIAAGMAPRRTIPIERALAALALGPTHGPRGLLPVSLLKAMVSWGGLDMGRAAGLLVPAAAGPWYRQAREAEAEPSPATLAAPLVLWALARGGPDEDYVAGAAASLARLTHADGSAVADAVAVALALQQALVWGGPPEPGWAAGRGMPERWGRALPSPGVEADFTPWLAGVARGVREANAPAEARAALRALEVL